MYPRVLLVGACPGADEEKHGRPFVGNSGQNLAVMLQRLHVLRPDIFPSERLDDYSLINAHSLPRYRGREGYDGRTEPLREEILANENRTRFATQIEHLEPTTIVYLGVTAEFAHEITETTVAEFQAYRTSHSSTPAWNTKADYIGIQADEKLRQWAEDRLEQII
jgi:uracil-DNA glycosylase